MSNGTITCWRRYFLTNTLNLNRIFMLAFIWKRCTCWYSLIFICFRQTLNRHIICIRIWKWREKATRKKCASKSSRMLWWSYKYFVYAQIGFGVNTNTIHIEWNVLKCDIVLYHLIVATRTTYIPYLWNIETKFWCCRMSSLNDSAMASMCSSDNIRIVCKMSENRIKSTHTAKEKKELTMIFHELCSSEHFSLATLTKTTSNAIHTNDKKDLLRSMFKNRWMHIAKYQQQNNHKNRTHRFYFFAHFLWYFLSPFLFSAVLCVCQPEIILWGYTIKIVIICVCITFYL